MTSKRKPQRKNALGRGLEALLPDSNINNPQASPIPSPSSLNEIDIKDIDANPFQPRTDFDQEALQQLAESIKLQGIIDCISTKIYCFYRNPLIGSVYEIKKDKLLR